MTEPNFLLLKSYTRHLVKKAGGVEAAAVLTDKSPAMISNYCNPESRYEIPVSVAIILTNHTRDTSLINHIRNECATAYEGEGKRNISEIMMMIASVHKEGADFTQVALEALADGDLKEAEVRAILRELIELQNAITLLMKKISTQGGEEISSISESAS